MSGRPLGCGLVAVAAVGTLACGGGRESRPPDESAPLSASALGRADDTSYIETGDLDAMRRRGRLRVLDRVRPEREALPRSGPPGDLGRMLVTTFAGELDLDVEWVTLDSDAEILQALLEGRGDVALGRIMDDGPVVDAVAHTVPFRHVAPQVVSRLDDPAARVEDLAGRRLAVQGGSPLAGAAERLRARVAGLTLDVVAATVHPDSLIDGVASGRHDLALVESSWVEIASAYRDDVRVAATLPDSMAHTAALRPDAEQLLAAANAFLLRALRQPDGPAVYRADLDGIRERRVLRLLTVNGPATYYLRRGQLAGFEYELAVRLAGEFGVRLEVVVAPSVGDLLPWLREGRGDLVAAGLPDPADPTREIVAARPYHAVAPTLVLRAAEADVTLDDLTGRTVVARGESAVWPSLEALVAGGARVTAARAPAGTDAASVVAGVGSGRFDTAIEEGHLAGLEVAWRDDVRTAGAVGDDVTHHWLVRADQPALLAAVNAFWDREYRGVFHNVVRRRYFGDGARRAWSPAADQAPDLSPYDDLVRRYAERYGLPWRVLVAQMYQESRFDPAARSAAGAVGLFQLLPSTAAEFGFDDLTDPETSIHAGARYLAWIADRFEPDLPLADRLAFTFASYNAGLGHVADARLVAARRGWNPDRWFDNVERAMLLLADPAVARTVRYGYCRGAEPVQYVRDILQRVGAYLQRS